MKKDPGCVQIDRNHSGAICNEIGERLRAALTENPPRRRRTFLA